MLGNPPWERVKLQEKEWFATRHEAIAKAPTAPSERSSSRLSRPRIHHFTPRSSMPAASRKAIVISSATPAVTRSVAAAMSTPTQSSPNSSATAFHPGVAQAASCRVELRLMTPLSSFSKTIMSTQTLSSCLELENNGFFLDAGQGHMVRFVLMTSCGPSIQVPQPKFLFQGTSVEDLTNEDLQFVLTLEEIQLLNPNTRTCPIFRTKRDAEITKGIYRRVPVLVDESKGDAGNPWGVTFSTMFHMTNDSHLFHTREDLEADGWTLEGSVFGKGDERMLPLYESKFMHLDNHRYSDYTHVLDKKRRHILPKHTPESLSNPCREMISYYWVSTSEVNSSLPADWQYTKLIGWRDVTDSRASARTTIAAMLPIHAANNKVLLLFPTRVNIWRAAANLTSFAFDYVARQKLSGLSFSYFIMRQQPVVPPTLPSLRGLDREDCYEKRQSELSMTSQIMCSKETGPAALPFRYSLSRRFQIRCELDAAFFHLYGIERDDVDYIMDTFPIVKRKDEEKYGHYRTKDRILQIYDEMAECMAKGEEWRSPLDPPPGDPRACWTEEEMDMWRRGEGEPLIEKYNLLDEELSP